MRTLLPFPSASRLSLPLALALLFSLLHLAGCTQGGSATTSPSAGPAAGPVPIPRTPAGIPVVRVRLLESQSTVQVSATANPAVKIDSEPQGMTLQIAGRSIKVNLNERGWVLGGLQRGPGVVLFTPPSDGALAINGKTYRGAFRFVPVGLGKFDIVNDVEIDSYLKSVVSKELLKDWHPEAFRAQAIVARTYALYEVATTGPGRQWDVHDDERSQVYGGLATESPLSVQGVDATRGIVVAYGDPGQERIFKAYFSSCCGGIGQSAADAFNDPNYPPLIEKNPGSLCSTSPRYTWGPVTLTKAEVTRRFRLWGADRERPERAIGIVSRIQPSNTNRFGRPVRYIVTDNKGTRYLLLAEELRNAINFAGEGRTVWSGYIQVRDNGNSFTFSGRGSGHGVGMCQYCAEAMARRGTPHEDIVRLSFPGARLVRAY